MALVAGLYIGTAPICQLLAIEPGNVTPVWIPSGIIMAAVLLRGRWIWPGVFAGAFAGNAWAYMGGFPEVSLGWKILSATANGAGDALCAVAGAALLARHATADRVFSSARLVCLFLFFGALLPGFISASIGVTGLSVAGLIGWERFLPTWLTWCVGDVMGVILLTPFLLVLGSGKNPRLSVLRWLEAGVVMSGLFVGAYLCVDLWHQEQVKFALMLLSPLLLWSVFRFPDSVSFCGVTLSGFLVLSWAAIYPEVRSSTIAPDDLVATLVELQIFLLEIAILMYVLAGVLNERSAAEASLRRTMGELQQAREGLLDAERMRTVGQLAAGVAHEVKNPLAVIDLGTEFLTSRVAEGDSESRRVLQEMAFASRRADVSVRSLLNLGTAREFSPVETSLEEIIKEAHVLTEHALVRHRVEWNCALPEKSPMLTVDPDSCVEVLVNLILNACDAIGSGGEVLVRVALESGGSDPAVVLSVEDTGEGIPEYALPRLFETFFTTKDKAGTGLGLSTSRMIMKMHGGQLTGGNRVGGGACFEMRFPASALVPPD
jgi:signal transduction histidine kinase